MDLVARSDARGRALGRLWRALCASGAGRPGAGARPAGQWRVPWPGVAPVGAGHGASLPCRAGAACGDRGRAGAQRRGHAHGERPGIRARCGSRGARRRGDRASGALRRAHGPRGLGTSHRPLRLRGLRAAQAGRASGDVRPVGRRGAHAPAGGSPCPRSRAGRARDRGPRGGRRAGCRAAPGAATSGDGPRPGARRRWWVREKQQERSGSLQQRTQRTLTPRYAESPAPLSAQAGTTTAIRVRSRWWKRCTSR